MKRSFRFPRPLLAAILIAVAALPLTQVAHAGPAEPAVPAELQVPAGHKLFLVGHAVGVQIHACTVTAGSYRWSFVGPRAELFDDNGKLLTTHFGGPSWQARDGSKVVGRLARPPLPVDATAIPWLFLEAASTTAGPDGERLTGTTHIQRIATTGGIAPPAANCNESTAGTTEEVPYTADYYFWKRA